MGAEHHNLVGEIAAGDLGQQINRIEGVVKEAIPNIERDAHGHVAVQQPGHAVVLLGGNRHGGRHRHGVWIAILLGAGHPNRAVVVAPEPRLEHGRHMFLREKLPAPQREVPTATPAAAASPWRHDTLRLQVLELLAGQSPAERVEQDVDLPRPAGARTRSSASPGTRLTRPAASSGSRPPARRRWWGGFSRSRTPLPRPWRDGGRAATPTARWSSTATASPSAAGARRGAPPVRRPACRPASSTIAAAPPPAT